jgi:hypothetical protein
MITLANFGAEKLFSWAHKGLNLMARCDYLPIESPIDEKERIDSQQGDRNKYVFVDTALKRGVNYGIRSLQRLKYGD